MNNTVVFNQFVIPQVPITKLDGNIGDSSATGDSFILDVADDITALFPSSGHILVGQDELMAYDNSTCGNTAFQFCVTDRVVLGADQAHTAPSATPDPFDNDGRIQLATLLDTAVAAPSAGNGDTAGAKTTLLTNVTLAQTVPFAISVGDSTNFSASGFVSISHTETTAFVPNPTNAPGSEIFGFNHSCGTAAQLCLISRGRQAESNAKYNHPLDGTTIACTVSPTQDCNPAEKMRSTVNQVFELDVASNAGFFPSSTLVLFTLDGTAGNNSAGWGAIETMSQLHGDGAVKLASQLEMQATGRGGTCDIGLFAADDCAMVAHGTSNTVVTGPNGYLVCRSRNEQPGAWSSSPAYSVGVFSICQTRGDPAGAPATFSSLDIPFAGSELITLNGLGQSFLSTGGFTHSTYPANPIPEVDSNGTGGDGILNLISPCILDFSPGTNLQIFVEVQTTKDYEDSTFGNITVVLDTVHDANTGGVAGDNCDDPAGTGDIQFDNYIYPELGSQCTNATDDDSGGLGGADGRVNDGCPQVGGVKESGANCANATDDDSDGTINDGCPQAQYDTDGDGCGDGNELDNNQSLGGKRDPWNVNDFFDPNGSGDVSISDISAVAAAYLSTSTGGPPYDVSKDRGGSHGPNSFNVGSPNGDISIADVSAIAVQFLNAC